LKGVCAFLDLENNMAVSEGSEKKKTRPEIKLVVWRGGVEGRTYSIQEGNNLLGRWDPDSGAFPEIDLESEDEEAKVSRKHAVIERRGQKLTIEDLGSLNGTYINRGARLKTGTQYPLQPGDEIIIGKTFLRVDVVPEE
jgi:pSer/pThr/pTyr-binding forkhead associated (FHA) protein